MLLMTDNCPNCGEELTSDNAAGGLCGRCLFERGIELTNTVSLTDGSTPGTHPFTAPDPVEVEADLLNFDVLELIGQGGMGAVYKAYQRSLDRTVAIKILPRQAAGGHEFAERFQREVRALARLRHEHIVMAYDYGLTDRYLYSAMEYVGGPNLREYLRDQTIAPRQALEIARDVCSALQYAHENGIVHRDIKPENILLDESGRVKIADFGLAKLLQPDPRELALTHTRHFMGTLHYMAPEQCERPHETDHRADIYSLGVVLYEMLTGELPLGRFDAPSGRANVDPRVDEVVFRALEKDAARRYRTAAAFGDAITAALRDLANYSLPGEKAGREVVSEQAVTSPPGEESIRRRSPRGPLIAAGFLGFLVVAYFGWQFLLKYQRDKESNTTLSIEAKGGDDAKPSIDGARRIPPTKARASTREVIKLTTINARETVDLLRKIFGDDRARIEADNTSNSIIVQADSETMSRIESLVSRIDQPGVSNDVIGLETSAAVETRVKELDEEIQKVDSTIRRNQYVHPLDKSAALRKRDALATEYTAAVHERARLRARRDDAGGLIGPVQIEFLEGLDQIVIRGDPRDVERTIELIKHLEGGGQRKQNETPEDLIRRLQGSTPKTNEQAGTKKPNQLVQVFQLKWTKASEAAELLRKVFGEDAGRFERDDRTNSIVVLADRETMSKIEALLKRLDQSGESTDQTTDRPDSAKLEQDRLRARKEAIDRGEYPEALLMQDIRSDPEMIELRKEIAEATKLYRYARSVAKDSQSDPGVQRAAEQLKVLKEAESKLAAELREMALAKLRWGVEGPPSAGKRTGAKEQIKIFQLQNANATETVEMLRKLYPDEAIRISADNRTNSVLVRGDRAALAEIEAILLRQDEAASSRSEKRDPPARKTDPQEQESRLRELQERLRSIEEQLAGGIPNLFSTSVTKALNEKAELLRREITKLQLHGPVVTHLPQARVEPDHPWLVEMRERLGNLNAAIAQLRLRQKDAAESPNLAEFKREARSLQQQIWDFEAALLTARRHTTQPSNLPQMNTDKH